METIAAHPFFTHDPAKIPKSLPSCCTHVAPDWQEDRNGNLVPILAEVDEQRSNPSNSSRRKEVLSENAVLPKKDSRSCVTQQTSTSKKPSKQFEIFSDAPKNRATVSNSHSSSSQIRSDDRRIYQSNGIDFKDDEELTKGISEKLSACTIKDSDKDSELDRHSHIKGQGDNDAVVLESMYSRLKDLGSLADANAISTKSRPAATIELGGAKKWVTRYVDYTSKYGLGFLFNDGR